MDNMSEVYAMLFAYGVMFAVIGVLAFLQMLARMVLFQRAGVEAWKSLYGRTKGFGVFAVFFPTIAMFMMWLQGSLYVGAQPHIFDRS